MEDTLLLLRLLNMVPRMKPLHEIQQHFKKLCFNYFLLALQVQVVQGCSHVVAWGEQDSRPYQDMDVSIPQKPFELHGF